MAVDPLTQISTRSTPQSQPDPTIAERQKQNAAGGYVFQVSDETKIHRFLTLGTTSGTYYTGEKELTKANTDVVLAAARDNGLWLVGKAAEISISGRAPKQNPAIFALAAVAGLGDEAARKVAFEHLPLVCRTGTTLFTFVRYLRQFRGWSKAVNRAVANWYNAEPPVIEEGQEPTEEQAAQIERTKTVDQLAYQVVKYRQRDGWAHRDLLRLSHPKTDDAARDALYRWIVTGECGEQVPALVHAFETAQDTNAEGCACHDGFRLGGHMGDCPNEITNLIAAHPLSWEMLPDASRTPEVWRALIRKGMPLGALIRQLPTLTRLGVLDNAQDLRAVTIMLTNPEKLAKARIHPINVLVAQKTYASGRAMRGDGRWTPKAKIIDALDAAFYAAFGAVEPSNRRTLIALDISGSMSWESISGMPITPREASAALSLVTLATEPNCDIVGFTGGRYQGRWYGSRQPITELSISPRQRLDDAVRTVSHLDAGPTDCALPFLWALEQGRAYDTVITMTDNETWVGEVHTHQALRQYRERTGIPTRFAAVAMTATDYSVADENDPLSLNVAGFDSAVPNLLADFSRGSV